MTAPHLDIDPDDFSTNPSGGPSFDEVVALRASRRAVLAGGMAGAAAFLTTNAFARAAAAAGSTSGAGAARLLGFTPDPARLRRRGRRPGGLHRPAVHPMGHSDHRVAYPAFVPGRQHGRRAGAAGRHAPRRHALLPAERGPRGSNRGLLVVNHEYTDEGYLHTGTTTRPAEGRVDRRRWSASPRPPTASPSSRSQRGVPRTLVRGPLRPEPPDHREHAHVLLRPRRRTPAAPHDRPTRRRDRRSAPSTTARTASRPGTPT